MAQAWNKHFAEEHCKWLDLEKRAQDFQSRVAECILKKKEGGRIKADFAMFPTNEMTKVSYFPVRKSLVKFQEFFFLKIMYKFQKIISHDNK